MIFKYTDTKGRKWTFGVRGTPYQIGIFRRVLSTFRGITGGERFSLSYLEDFRGNDAFIAEVEAAVLSALAARYPAPPKVSTPPPQASTSTAQAQEPPTVTTSRTDDADTDADEYRPTYYWENF